MTLPRFHAVVLAGGSGTRFWPLSRDLSPKQLLSIFGAESLIGATVARVLPLACPECVHVVTGERLADEIRNHLKSSEGLRELDLDYLVEPSARNTGPAIALAAAYLSRLDPDAVMAVLPSDHILEDGEVWRRTMRAADALAARGYLVTIGLRAHTPETGYGYIRAGRELGERLKGVAARAVAEFVEKPDAETAARYVADGSYLWNSGMLVARADTVLAEFELAGERAATKDSAEGRTIAATARSLANLPKEAWHSDEARDAFEALPSVPFDKAVLEVSDRVAVIPTDLDWSDVGSLLAIERLAVPDGSGNVVIGRVADVDSEDCILYSADRLLGTIGLRDLMVIDTADATLVAPKERAQDVRHLVEKLREAGAPEVVQPRTSLRPWGSWTLLMKAEDFQIKSIEVLPGRRLSLQSHRHRSEHWIVIEGNASVVRDGTTMELGPNRSSYLAAGTVHRLANPGPEILRVIEVAVGGYLGEDDIVRFEDDFGRREGADG